MDSYLPFLYTYSCCILGLALNIPIVTTENNDLVAKQNQMDNLTAMNTIVSDVMIQFDILENWSRLCNISQTGFTDFNIVCFIKGNSNLKFSDFRNFTSRLSSNIKLDLFVICDNGRIRFPWPFRADKLNRIYIKHCIIKDYLTEFKNSLIDSIPDTVKYLQIENVTICLNVRELHDSFSKANSHMTKAAECGPENAYSITKRRTKHIFEDIHNTSHFADFSNALADHSHYFNVQKRTCMYNNLEVFEISGMEDLERSVIDKIVYTDIADNLKILNFSGNGIYDSLHKLQGWRLRFPMMEYLDFSDNNIKSLPLIRDYGRTIKGIKSVGIIDVRRNKITSLTKGMIDSFSTHKFVKVDISENPFLCDCDIIEVMEYLSSKTMPKAYDYLGSLECANPSNVRGRQLLNLSLTDLNCTRNNETGINVSILGISIITIIVSIITFLAIYFRILIKIILYTRLNIKFPCQFENGTNEDKEYDAFIAYSEKDVDWVMRTALPKLESKDAGKAYKLCLHHRDYIIGNSMADNIFNSVENSYHSVLLISSEFLKSEWCMMEFRAAMLQSLHDKNCQFIILLKDMTTLDGITPDLKSCLNSYTYLKIGDFFFWDRLKYAISFGHKRRQNK